MSSDAANQAENGAQNGGAFSLATILNEENDQLEHPDFKDRPEGGWDEEGKDTQAAEGFCIECEGASMDEKFNVLVLNRLSFQTNLLNSVARLARTIIAKYASPPNIARVLAKAMLRNHSPPQRLRKLWPLYLSQSRAPTALKRFIQPFSSRKTY
jgi:hypothetical protein